MSGSTLFGCPIAFTLEMEDGLQLDITDALVDKRGQIEVDLNRVLGAIHAYRARQYRPQPVTDRAAVLSDDLPRMGSPEGSHPAE